MRIFLAIPIPQEIKEKLARVSMELPNDVRRVAPSNYHITLKFFGEIKEAEVQEIIKKLKIIQFQPFTLEVQRLGTFPSESYVRVVWAGTEGTGLEKIMESVDALFSGAKESVGHITLARVEKTHDWKPLLSKYKDVSFGTFEVNEIVLMKSELGPAGAKYSVMETIKSNSSVS